MMSGTRRSQEMTSGMMSRLLRRGTPAILLEVITTFCGVLGNDDVPFACLQPIPCSLINALYCDLADLTAWSLPPMMQEWQSSCCMEEILDGSQPRSMWHVHVQQDSPTGARPPSEANLQTISSLKLGCWLQNYGELLRCDFTN